MPIVVRRIFMNDDIICFEGGLFKRFRNTNYYCSEMGEVYSSFSNRILSPLKRRLGGKIYLYVDINFGHGQRHVAIHRMVYEAWNGKIPEGLFILHKNDISTDNRLENLSAGTQKENIADCFRNRHRVGKRLILEIYDREKKKRLIFCPAKDFIKYSGHSAKNGGVSRMISRKWFQKRYDLIRYEQCKNLQQLESVTTIPDECREVD